MSDIPEDDRQPPDEANAVPSAATSPEASSDAKPRLVYNADDEEPPVIKAKRIPRKVKNEEFPHAPEHRDNATLPATIENLKVILRKEGFRVRYNRDKKRNEIEWPGHEATTDNRENVGLTKVISLAARYGFSTGLVPGYLDVIAAENPYSPAEDWIRSKPWDGVDRLPALYDSVHAVPGYPETLKEILLYRWLLSVVAAALIFSGFRTRGVLVFQGPQGINKTTWVAMLISDPVLRELLIKLDHQLAVGNKDSILGAIEHWIVELGELESSFKRDMARQKGFLTRTTDKVRRPYTRMDSSYPRRTVFIATVNDPHFLVDNTGNTRWWIISVVKLEPNHGIDMQQLFAQLAIDLEAGAQWWLTPEEEAALAEVNQRHQVVSAIDELIRSYFDPARIGRSDNPSVTASDLLRKLGIQNPTNPQCREAGATLRQLLGEPTESQGSSRWRFPGTLNGDRSAFELPAEDPAKRPSSPPWGRPAAPPLHPPKIHRPPAAPEDEK